MALGQYLALVLAAQTDEFSELCKKIAESRKDLKSLVAEVRVDRTGKYEDSSGASKGRLWWKPGALLVEETDLQEPGAKPTRTLVRDSEAIVLIVKPRKAEIYPLERTFLPAALLRDGIGEGLRKDWEVKIAARPEQTKLPQELATKGGDKPKPRDVKLPGGRPRTGSATEGEEGRHLILELKPRREAIKEYVHVVRVHLHKDSLHVEKICVDDAMAYTVWRLSEWKALETVDDKVFELDLKNVKVERK